MKTWFDKDLRKHMMLSYYNYGLTQHFCTQLKALLKQTLTVASTSIRALKVLFSLLLQLLLQQVLEYYFSLGRGLTFTQIQFDKSYIVRKKVVAILN